MKNLTYNVGPITNRMPIGIFSKIEYDCTNELFEQVSDYINSALKEIPDYCERKIRIKSATLTSHCHIVSVGYDLEFVIDEDKFVEEIKMIAAKYGFEVEKTRFHYYVDSPSYKIYLKQGDVKYFSTELMNREKAVQAEIKETFRPLMMMFQFEYDFKTI